jgi:hypothetical protein
MILIELFRIRIKKLSGDFDLKVIEGKNKQK